MLVLLALAIGWLCPSSVAEAATKDYREAVKPYAGMVETGGYNRGPFIDAANRDAGVPLGSSYCASSVRYILKSCALTTDTRMSARAKDYIGSESINAVDVWKGKAKIPDDCVGVMTRKGGGHIWFKIKQMGDQLTCFDFNSSPDGLRGSQYDGRWSGYKVRSIKQTCSPLNAFRTIAFTRIRPAVS